MPTNDTWLLPQGMDDLLPAEAALIERVRRELLDLLAGWGYRLVAPPLVEHLQALLSGLGSDLEHQTFKLTDPLSGRLLGVRADMTPQVARIDAHRLGASGPERLCYAGPVLHSEAAGYSGTREPLQLGAELYGHRGVDSDLEVVELMLTALRHTGLDGLTLGVSHMGVFAALAEWLGLDAPRRQRLFDALQRKAVPDLAETLEGWGVAGEQRGVVMALPALNGGPQVLAQARRALAPAGAGLLAALDELEELVVRLDGRVGGDCDLHVDCAELRGYHYHTGVIFEAYVRHWGQAVAWGGRYDGVGAVFGRDRPATGFSMDLKLVASLLQPVRPAGHRIWAPADDDPVLVETIAGLRAAGEVVVRALAGDDSTPAALGCSRMLVRADGRWSVRGVDGQGPSAADPAGGSGQQGEH